MSNVECRMTKEIRMLKGCGDRASGIVSVIPSSFVIRASSFRASGIVSVIPSSFVLRHFARLVRPQRDHRINLARSQRWNPAGHERDDAEQ